MTDTEPQAPGLRDIVRCFEGAVPAVVATSAADGTPNVTYLSRVQAVDGERVALSNQFFSKTARNLAENPRASLLLVDPVTYDEYRLTLAYERTERRGPVFERLRGDVEVIAALSGMTDVFNLRAADIYRVLDIQRMPNRGPDLPAPARPLDDGAMAPLGDLVGRLSRCTDLDHLVDLAVRGLADDLGYGHALLLLLDESGRSLYTIAAHGYSDRGVGSEVAVGEGIIGMAAEQGRTIRLGNLRQIGKYSHAVQRSFEAAGVETERAIALPGLATAESQLAAPTVAFGQVVGVLLVEQAHPVAFDADDERVLAVVAAVVGAAVEAERQRSAETSDATAASRSAGVAPAGPITQVRFFPADGSTFLNGEYLIKGVAGRILWSLLDQFDSDGRVDFTNREVRLDTTLELPEFRDNLESRLILLSRRLEDRGAPIRIQKTGRGRFRLLVDCVLQLESVQT
jgi:adenylate cyclase